MVGMKYNSPKKYLDTLFILQLSEYLCIKKPNTKSVVYLKKD